MVLAENRLSIVAVLIGGILPNGSLLVLVRRNKDLGELSMNELR